MILKRYSLLNMPGYAWMCLYKQNSEYAWLPKYAKILNTAKFWIWQGSQYGTVTQRYEYARICLDRVFNMSWVQNMPGFWMYQGSEYARVTQGSKYAKIWLYMCHTIYSARSFNKLMSTYWEVGFSEPGQRSKMEPFGKIILVLNCFCEKLHLKSLRGFFI